MDDERLGIVLEADDSGLDEAERSALGFVDNIESIIDRTVQGPQIKVPEPDTRSLQTVTDKVGLFTAQLDDIATHTPALTLAFRPLNQAPATLDAASQSLQRFGAFLADLSTTAQRNVSGTVVQAQVLAAELAEAANLITTLPRALEAGGREGAEHILEISAALEDVTANMRDLGDRTEVKQVVEEASAALDVLREKVQAVGERPITVTVTPSLNEADLIAAMNRLQERVIGAGASDALGRALDPAQYADEINRLADLVAQGLERAPEHLSRALSTSVEFFLADLNRDIGAAFSQALEARGVVQVPVAFVPETDVTIPVQGDTDPLRQAIARISREIEAQPPLDVPVVAPTEAAAAMADLAAAQRDLTATAPGVLAAADQEAASLARVGATTEATAAAVASLNAAQTELTSTPVSKDLQAVADKATGITATADALNTTADAMQRLNDTAEQTGSVLSTTQGAVATVPATWIAQAASDMGDLGTESQLAATGVAAAAAAVAEVPDQVEVTINAAPAIRAMADVSGEGKDLRQDLEVPFKITVDTAELQAVRGILRQGAQGAAEAQDFFSAFVGAVVPELKAVGFTAREAMAGAIALFKALDEGTKNAGPVGDALTTLAKQQAEIARNVVNKVVEPEPTLTDAQKMTDALDTLQRKQDEVLAGARVGGRGVGPAPPPPPPIVPPDVTGQERSFQILASGLGLYKKAADAADASTESLRETTIGSIKTVVAYEDANAAAERQMRNLGAAMKVVDRELGNTNEELAEGIERHASHGRAINTAANAMAAEAAQALELRGPLVQLSEALLDISLGNVAAIATFGAIAAVAVIWRQVTKEAHDAASAEREALDAFIKRVEAEQFDEATLRGKLRLRVQDLDLQHQNLVVLEQIAKSELDVGLLLSAKLRLLLNENKLREANAALAASERAKEQQDAENLRQATVARNKQFVQDDLAIQLAGLAAEEQALRNSLARREITQEEFFDRRERLARTGAEAEIQAIRDQALIASRDVKPGETDAAARQRHAAEQEHFETLIRLRQIQLGQQLEQISHEEELLRVEALREIQANVNRQILTTPRVEVGFALREVPEAEVRAAVERVASALQNIPIDNAIEEQFERDQVAAEQLATTIDVVAGAVNDVLDAAEELHTIGANAREAARGVVNLIQAFQGLAVARQHAAEAQTLEAGSPERAAAIFAAQIEKIQGIVGIITSGINILSSIGQAIFGGGESEHDRILRENNEKLEQLGHSLDRQIEAQDVAAAGAIAAFGAAQRVVTAQRLAALPPGTGLTGEQVLAERERARILQESNAEFIKSLEDAGFTLEEWAAIIEQNTGIRVLDDEGHLVADAFEQARIAIDKWEEQITHFTDTLATQSRILETEDLLGIGGRSEDERVARLERTREIELAGLSLDPATEARIRALDLETEAGRQAFLEFNRMLFIMAQNGEITAEQLGKFADVDALLDPINDAAQGVRDFEEATKDAADRLSDLNIPAGFRRELLAFEAGNRGTPFPTPVLEPPIIETRPIDGRGVTIPRDALEPAAETAADTFNTSVREADLGRQIAERFLATLAQRQGIGTPTGLQTGGVRSSGLTIQVNVNGSAATSDVRVAAEAGVRAALRQIGLVQSGDTLQFPVD